ncbi:putative V-type ATPase V0 subunit e [Cryptosporidium felis]|nr:putative V-type ATPase V0 subunit e [Cryptosporidium felis]
MAPPYDNAVFGSIVFGVLGFVAAISSTIYFGIKGSKNLSRSDTAKTSLVVVVMMTFCLWIMWFCVYLSQMFPLINPIHKAEEH